MISVDYRLSERQCEDLHRELCLLCRQQRNDICVFPEGFYCEEHDLAFMNIKAIAQNDEDYQQGG